MFDLGSGFNKDPMTKEQWLTRCIFLETIAGVPGMVGGMARHMRSLRTLKHDHGLIHHLLNEAENERTHLFIFLRLKQPGKLFQLLIALSQGIFFNLYFLAYLASPRFCHRFVGYLEEEAVHTYTMMLEAQTSQWLLNTEAPAVAAEYYELGKEVKMRDVILSVRADESIHRDVNHRFADIFSQKEGSINCEMEVERILEKDYRVKRESSSGVDL